MAIYDLGTASLAANGEVTGVGTTWKAPLTLIRVGATIVFKTEPVKIYTISEIISDTQINVYNPNSETVPAGTGYAILAHDGITVQGLAQDVAETLRYYQSRETEVADAVDAFSNFDATDFNQKVSLAQSSAESSQLSAGNSANSAAISELSASQAAQSATESQQSAVSASNSADMARASAESVSGALISSFESGGVIESRSQQIIWLDSGNPKSYVWMGDLPKTVAAGSTPETTGGVALGAWASVGDDSLRSELESENGLKSIQSAELVVETFEECKLLYGVSSRLLSTKGHTIPGIGSATYYKDGTVGAASSGNEMKFFDADGFGWAMMVGPVAVVPITRFGVIPGIDSVEQASSNANNMKRGGELVFDYGMRISLPPGKTFIGDVIFSKPVGVEGVFSGLGAQQTGTGAGKDGFSEWVHRGTGWGIYYEPWSRSNGEFAPDGIVLKDFGFRGNTYGGCLGGIKINDDSVITDETKAKRELIMDNITISGCWTGYGLKISWTFINNFYALKIWDCAVAMWLNRANSSFFYGLELEGCLTGGVVNASAGVAIYGLMAEYINNSRSYYTMPSDYPVDPTWASGVNSYVGIGLRVRSSQFSVIGGYTESIPVIWQCELDSDFYVSRTRNQILTTTNHVVRSHGGRNITFTDNIIEGSITAAAFYRTPSMPYVARHKITNNVFEGGSSRPTSNPALGFFGEFDVYRSASSDAGVQTVTQNKSEIKSNFGGAGDTGGYPVTTGGDVLSSGIVNHSASGSSYTCTIGTTVKAVGLVNINVPAGCALTVAVSEIGKWVNGSQLAVSIVSLGTSGSPISVAFSSDFKLSTGNADISTATGKRAVFEFRLINGIFYQCGTSTSVG